MGHDSQILTNNLLWAQSKQLTYIIWSIRLKCNIPCLPFNHRLSHLRTYYLLLQSNICYILHMFGHFPQTDSTDVTYLHRTMDAMLIFRTLAHRWHEKSRLKRISESGEIFVIIFRPYEVYAKCILDYGTTQFCASTVLNERDSSNMKLIILPAQVPKLWFMLSLPCASTHKTSLETWFLWNSSLQG